jgi:preprotein translocase subunit SecD
VRTAGAIPLVWLSVAGCVGHNGPATDGAAKPKAATLAVHLAYDQAREGCRAATDRQGQTVYVDPRVEIDRTDVEIARALHSGQRSLVQVTLNRIGRQRLYALTSVHQDGARLAVFIDDKLVSAQPIYGPVADGQIYLLGVYSRAEAEEVAAALSQR